MKNDAQMTAAISVIARTPLTGPRLVSFNFNHLTPVGDNTTRPVEIMLQALNGTPHTIRAVIADRSREATISFTSNF